jgi:hypothetical protein
MINEHLSETEIQEYALHKNACKPGIIQHIELCENCKTKAANYQMLFNEISQQPKPAFDFDMTALVIPQLPPGRQETATRISSAYFFVFFSLFVIAIPSYIFRKYILNIFKGVLPMMMYLIIITAAAILLFQCIEMYKKYQKQLNALN